MKKGRWKEEELSEDFCFTCKDGGHLRVCDFKKCLKAYHPSCVGKDDSFLEDDDHWTCGLHSCNCGKSSSFQCFCCPTSYCPFCITSAEYVQVKKNKGFCINCLRLAKMIAEDRHVDSDGEEVDFSNTETYEFLFKDYWEIVKDRERLTTVDVQAADALLKRGEIFRNESDSDKPIDEESISEPDDLEDDCDEKSLFIGLRGKRGRKKNHIRKPKKERVFVGWASEELVTFLASIGKNTKERLSQLDVTEIIKDYVQSKNLFQANKKRKHHVVPDEMLRIIFRKKRLKYHKIFDLVKNHLAEKQSEQSDEFSFSSEENEGAISAKKRCLTNSDHKTPKSETNHSRKKVLEPSKSCHAAIVADNIKLAYLKRSLLLELLKNPEACEEKVVGCFVRIKNDPKACYYLVQKAYQLGQVIGIKRIEQTYKIGETDTDIVLCVSNFSKDIKISIISDDDFEEEECQDLRLLAKKGRFKQPTIAELERKIRSVHEDIVNHWIGRELVKLQKLIDRANEKGWRKELLEYIDRRELLRTPEERKRLVEEIPEVVPDVGDTDIDTERYVNLHGSNRADTHDRADQNASSVEGLATKCKGLLGNYAGFVENVAERKAKGNEMAAMTKASDADTQAKVAGRMHQESEPNNRGRETEDLEMKVEGSPMNRRAAEIEGSPMNRRPTEIEVIDLDDDDDNDITDKGNDLAATSANPESSEAVWHYIDPSGNEQGPFTLPALSRWRDCGYFDDDFKVWKSGQREEDAILLTVALGSALPASQ